MLWAEDSSGDLRRHVSIELSGSIHQDVVLERREIVEPSARRKHGSAFG